MARNNFDIELAELEVEAAMENLQWLTFQLRQLSDKEVGDSFMGHLVRQGAFELRRKGIHLRKLRAG